MTGDLDLHGLSEYEHGRELAEAEHAGIAASLAPLRRQWSGWVKGPGAHLTKWISSEDWDWILRNLERLRGHGLECVLADPEGQVVWEDGRELIWNGEPGDELGTRGQGRARTRWEGRKGPEGLRGNAMRLSAF